MTSDQQHHDQRRKRSRSPSHRERHIDVKRARSRSPRHRRHHHDRPTASAPEIHLPFQQSQLRKSDFTEYRNLFAEYLDIQKDLSIDDLKEEELKGRWKSFVGKWNRGELAEGWYDTETRSRIDERFAAQDRELFAASPDVTSNSVVENVSHGGYTGQRAIDNEEGDADDDYGPEPPNVTIRSSGPAIPNAQDLQQRDEMIEEDWASRRADIKFERKTERNLQKERMEELAPRAEPGTRERQLEKKRETTAANRAFRDAKSPGAEEIGEGDLMGADGADSYKAKLKARSKVKNEREIRKEEVLRARAAEREQRLAEHRRKEEKTMEKLKAIAKQRFG